MNTRTLTTETLTEFEAAVHAAAQLLKEGELVAVPTETVYGLAANAFNAVAVQKIFEAKGRPSRNPIIVHVEGIDMAQQCVAGWDSRLDRLTRAFWPGPLTLVLPRADLIPDCVTAGGSTVGIRWSSHPFMRALIAQCGFPIAAPSANLSNHVSPTHAGHVLKQLAGKVRLIVDGGPCQVGIESTVLDVSGSFAKILRPGMIHEESIFEVIPRSIGASSSDDASQSVELKSPGLLDKHYAPQARLMIASWSDAQSFKDQAKSWRKTYSSICLLCHSQIPPGMDGLDIHLIPHDSEAYARALYAELHRCDEVGADLIVVEEPPDRPEWRGIRDRLRRAASKD